jgi:hypothetical protein
MANELTIVSMGDKLAYAQTLADSGMLPAAYRRNPANVLWAVEYGAALGIPPVVAIGLIHVMDGKPVASATMIGGLVRKAGHRLRVESDDTRAVAKISRSDDKEYWFEASFSMADAKRAGLDRNPTWGKYPKAMMTARATTAVARMACPEVLMGVEFTAEELGGSAMPEDLPSGAAVVVSEGRWSDVERKAFCAELGRLGIEYDAAAAWSESRGRPRPSAMTAAMRTKMLQALAGPMRAEFDAWCAPAPAPAPVDADGVVDADEPTEPFI